MPLYGVCTAIAAYAAFNFTSNSPFRAHGRKWFWFAKHAPNQTLVGQTSRLPCWSPHAKPGKRRGNRFLRDEDTSIFQHKPKPQIRNPKSYKPHPNQTANTSRAPGGDDSFTLEQMRRYLGFEVRVSPKVLEAQAKEGAQFVVTTGPHGVDSMFRVLLEGTSLFILILFAVNFLRHFRAKILSRQVSFGFVFVHLLNDKYPHSQSYL